MDSDRSSKPGILPNSAAERRLAAIASPFLALLGVGGLLGIHAISIRSRDSDWRNTVLNAICFIALEVFVTSLILLACLLFLAATFRPRWSLRAIRFAERQFLHAMIGVLVGFGLLAAAGYVMFELLQ